MADFYLYVIVNTELASMNPGKAQAHSGHAASAFVWQMVFNDYKHNSLIYNELFQVDEFRNWIGDRGFGTQINLVPKEQFPHAVQDFYKKASMLGYPAGHVIDPTYPYFVPEEVFEHFNLSDSKWFEEKRHTLAPKYIAKTKSYICFRNQYTATWVFCNKNDQRLAESLSQFDLHP